jgi:hypothetical protein
LTWWLTAEGVSDRRFAASLKLEWRAATQKARSSRKGGVLIWATMSIPFVSPEAGNLRASQNDTTES